MQHSFDDSGNIFLDYSGNIKDIFVFNIRWTKSIRFAYVNGVGDFVCEVLNQNYFAIVEKMECGDYTTGVELSRTDPLAHDERERIKETMIKEFSELDFSLVKKIVWEVFCSTEHETLSAKDKFFAYTKALCIASKEGNPFLQGMQVNIFPNLSRIVRIYKESDIMNIVSDDFIQAFGQICATLKNNSKNIDIEYLMYFSSIKDVFIYLFIEMVKQNGMIKKCPNCGRFFSPIRRINGTYCSYPSPQDPQKTCQEYVSYANYLRKTQTDMATKLHKQIYNIKANRAKRNPDNEELWEDVEAFLAQSRQWKKDVKNGDADEAQYIEWLQKIKDNDA